MCAITGCYRASVLSPQTSSLMVYVYLEKADAWWKHRAAHLSWSLSKLSWCLSKVWALWVCDPRGRGLQRVSSSACCWNEYTVIAAPLFCSLHTFSVSNHSCQERVRERAQESALLAVHAGVPRTNWGEKSTLAGCCNEPLTTQGVLQTQHSQGKTKSQLTWNMVSLWCWESDYLFLFNTNFTSRTILLK